MTPRRLILQAAALFREKGVPGPAFDASALLAHLTGRPALELRLDDETPLSDEVTGAYQALCRRRADRVPLQHLTGEAWFCGRPFQTGPEALIPRPETELLLRRARALESALREQVGGEALDLCCGGGCIAVTLALDTGFAVTASDISEPALDLTRRNAQRLGASVRTVRSDMLEAFRRDGGSFALILSNPPYIPSGECDHLQPEVMHDPRLALDGGADGLAFYRRIAADVPRALLPGGMLLLEIGCGQAEAVSGLLTAAGFEAIRIYQDEAGLDRAVEARLPAAFRQESPCTDNTSESSTATASCRRS